MADKEGYEKHAGNNWTLGAALTLSDNTTGWTCFERTEIPPAPTSNILY